VEVSAGNPDQTYFVKAIVVTAQGNILALDVPVEIQDHEN
jgi:hypothetical protein